MTSSTQVSRSLSVLGNQWTCWWDFSQCDSGVSDWNQSASKVIKMGLNLALCNYSSTQHDNISIVVKTCRFCPSEGWGSLKWATCLIFSAVAFGQYRIIADSQALMREGHKDTRPCTSRPFVQFNSLHKLTKSTTGHIHPGSCNPCPLCFQLQRTYTHSLIRWPSPCNYKVPLRVIHRATWASLISTKGR